MLGICWHTLHGPMKTTSTLGSFRATNQQIASVCGLPLYKEVPILTQDLLPFSGFFFHFGTIVQVSQDSGLCASFKKTPGPPSNYFGSWANGQYGIATVPA